MENAGKMFLKFGLLSTVNNFRFRFYGAVVHRIRKCRDICKAEIPSSGNQYILKDLPAIVVPDIRVKFAERAAGTVLKLDNYFHMSY